MKKRRMKNKMTVKATKLVDWDVVRKAALATIWRDSDGSMPSDEWKKKMLLARHSPIEALIFLVEMREIPYWVSVHLVRHKVGITHWVSSQRDDRHENPLPRAEMPQGALVNHTMIINAQALIAVSRKRLCNLASGETRKLWSEVKRAIADIDPIMAWAMRPECEWCGDFCLEMKGCGAHDKMEFGL